MDFVRKGYKITRELTIASIPLLTNKHERNTDIAKALGVYRNMVLFF